MTRPVRLVINKIKAIHRRILHPSYSLETLVATIPFRRKSSAHYYFALYRIPADDDSSIYREFPR